MPIAFYKVFSSVLQPFDLFTCFLPARSMEETVRTLLQNQDSLEGPKMDPLDLMKAYKVREGPSVTTRYVVL